MAEETESENINPICYPLPVYISFTGADEGILVWFNLIFNIWNIWTYPGFICGGLHEEEF